MTIVSHKHRVIFLKTRKTASTTIEMLLSSVAGKSCTLSRLDGPDEEARAKLGIEAQNDNIPLRNYGLRDFGRLLFRQKRARIYNHMPAAKVKKAVGKKVWNDYLKVTVERDPFDRVLSLYKWKSRQASYVDINQFVSTFDRKKLSNFDIYAIDDAVCADVILKFENLEEDLNLLWELLELEMPKKLPHAKKSASVSAQMPDQRLTQSSIDIIKMACRNELELDYDRYNVSNILKSEVSDSKKA